MGLLPDILISTSDSTGLSSRQVQAASRSLARTELGIYRHGLGAQYKAACDRLDSQALGEACRASFDVEVNLLEDGLARCNGSRAKAELLTRKVEMASAINNSRIQQRFGG